MIDSTWKRIAGVHTEEDGTVGVVWLAHDTMSSVVHCYDAALFKREVFAVIAEGIGARGRHYPLAWRKKDEAFCKKLQDAGINVLPEPCSDAQSVAEVISREIWQKLRTSQFRVERRVGEWLAEYRKFYRDGEAVPKEGFPLMAATRHAIEMLPYAKPERMPGSNRPNAPKLAIV